MTTIPEGWERNHTGEHLGWLRSFTRNGWVVYIHRRGSSISPTNRCRLVSMRRDDLTQHAPTLRALGVGFVTSQLEQ